VWTISIHQTEQVFQTHTDYQSSNSKLSQPTVQMLQYQWRMVIWLVLQLQHLTRTLTFSWHREDCLLLLTNLYFQSKIQLSHFLLHSMDHQRLMDSRLGMLSQCHLYCLFFRKSLKQRSLADLRTMWGLHWSLDHCQQSNFLLETLSQHLSISDIQHSHYQN